MSYQPDDAIDKDLKKYYQSSERYRDDLLTHDEGFLEPYICLVRRYVQNESQILDIGCGTALSTRLLSQSGYHAIGLDLSPFFLAEEKKHSPDSQLVAGDALKLPFPDETFDAVAAFEFIEHVPNVPACLDEIVRVLKVRGHVIFHSPNLLSPYLPAFDILRMMLGGQGRPVFAETRGQAWQWLKYNLRHSLKKRFSWQPDFMYRQPDLSENRIGGDADSVYLANQMDLSRYLYNKGFAIDQLGHAMSLKNKFLVALTPNFAPYMGVVAHKRSIASQK